MLVPKQGCSLNITGLGFVEEGGEVVVDLDGVGPPHGVCDGNTGGRVAGDLSGEEAEEWFAGV